MKKLNENKGIWKISIYIITQHYNTLKYTDAHTHGHAYTHAYPSYTNGRLCSKILRMNVPDSILYGFSVKFYKD